MDYSLINFLPRCTLYLMRDVHIYTKKKKKKYLLVVGRGRGFNFKNEPRNVEE